MKIRISFICNLGKFSTDYEEYTEEEIENSAEKFYNHINEFDKFQIIDNQGNIIIIPEEVFKSGIIIYERQKDEIT